jgi:hypothetical protein
MERRGDNLMSCFAHGYYANRLVVGTTAAIVLAALLVVCPSSVGVSRASVPGPHWKIFSMAEPTYFKDGDTADHYTLIAVNDGGTATNGSAVTVADALPSGLTATAIKGTDTDHVSETVNCELATLTCTAPSLNAASGDCLVITITVAVATSASESVTNSATISGGGAEAASVNDQTSLSNASVPFGISFLDAEVTEADGSPDARAGSHPYQMMTSLAFDVGSLDQTDGSPLASNADARDIYVALPRGLVGDPGTGPRCSQLSFQTVSRFFNCPADTQVGYMRLFFYGGGTAVQTVPVYNIEPPPGQPAELGFSVSTFVHIPMFFNVRSNGDYGLTAQLTGISEADPVLASILTLWGVPADPSHDSRREGTSGCIENCTSNVPPKPFLTLPTSCPGTELGVSMTADSWQNPGTTDPEGEPYFTDPNWKTASSSLPAMTGCEGLGWDPSISVAPESTQAGSPSGYTVDFHVPQSNEPEGLAPADLRKAVVTLPAGTVVSPSAADGLQACADTRGVIPNPSAPPGDLKLGYDQFGLHSNVPATCLPASTIGTVEVSTPLLTRPLKGQVFLGKPRCGPCSDKDAAAGKMLRLFIQAQSSGVTVKLAGSVSVNPSTGVLTTTFDNNPQLPFEDLKLTFNGGSRAPLANPSTCGEARTTADLTPWGAPEMADALPFSGFEVTGCPGSLPFAPSFSAGTTDNQAGGFSPFVVTISRVDGEQHTSAIDVQTPPGLLGMLSTVPLCQEPRAALGTCDEASLIGHTTVAVGPGSSPFWIGGKVYLTGPYEGGPFGLSIVVPAIAGPFNLGTVVVRAAISVDPHTSQITVASDPLPQMLRGIPLQLKTVNVAIDRAGFIFNPTNCQGLTVNGTVVSAEGASVKVASPFHAANCATLPFTPKFSAASQAKTSRAGGASLHVTVASSAGQANIARVAVTLPKRLAARLSTIQQACPDAVFNANPASCPVGSNIGTSQASTPVLSGPLSGPVYLVSHGGAAFPDIVVVLQGQGITVDLVGSINISKKSFTSSTFASVPDVPISRFDLLLPTGPHSALSATGSLCTKQSLNMPTTILGQNGAQIAQTTRIKVAGCPKPRKKRGKKASRG